MSRQVPLIALLCAACIPAALRAGEAPAPDALPKLEGELVELRSRKRSLDSLLGLLGERLPPGADEALDQARDAVTAARRALEELEAGTGLDAIEEELQAALDARNAKTDELLADNPKWQAVSSRLAEVEGHLAPFEGKDELDPDELHRYSALREERDRLRHAVDRTYNQWRHTPDVEPLNKALWEVILEKERPTKKKIEGYGDAAKRLRRAEKALRQARPVAALAAVDWAAAEHAELEAAMAAKQEEIDACYAAVLGENPRWHHQVKVTRMHKGKPKEHTVSLWLPPDADYVRGIVMSDGIVIGPKLVKSRRIRFVAARHDLAVIQQYDSTFSGEQAPQRMNEYLSKLAEASGHPELTKVPFFTLGHSTGGIYCRNVAYWRPDRVLGILHIKSGNLHQHIWTENRSLAGVPFVAVNGEFECYGPEGGGKGGIRGQWENQTQWIMLREQLLRRRRADPDNLMGLIYDAGGGHTSWNRELTRFSARFLHKAASARLPEPPADPATEVTCKPLTAADGWLVDADLKDPGHEPAPYADYAGDKAEAFWYLDEELARTAQAITGQSLVPDPSKLYPVPEDWP